MSSRRYYWLFLLLMLIVTTLLILRDKGAFQDVHWDMPNYPYQAKRFAETSYLINYRANSTSVADAVHEGAWDDTYAYWIFTRLGNVVLLGAITSWLGTDVMSLELAAWFYSALLALGAFLSVLLAVSIIKALGPASQKGILIGAAVSAVLYISSDVYIYLTGNLISEVPALILLNIGGLLLILSMMRKAYYLAILSGVSAFLLYTVRMDAVFYYLAFVIALLPWMHKSGWKSAWWPGLVLSAATALGLYLLYAWIFFPLADPLLFGKFGEVWGNLYGGFKAEILLKDLTVLLVGGGLLWFGALLSLFQVRNSLVLKFGWTWFLISIVPWILRYAAAGGAQIEVRMFTLLLPPLFITSTVGWANLAGKLEEGQKWIRWKLVAVIFPISVAVAISHDGPYNWLRDLPGGWRLQYLKGPLRVPLYQRKSYPLEAMSEVSAQLYSDNSLKLVLVSPEIEFDGVNLIRYLGPAYSQDTDLTMYREPQVWKGGPIPDVEPVVFRKLTDQGRLDNKGKEYYSVWILRRRGSAIDNPGELLELEPFAHRQLNEESAVQGPP